MQSDTFVRPEIKDFSPYSPGLSIDEIREKYALQRVIKMASNENPLGVSPLVQKTLAKHIGGVFRYPRSGSPDLRAALARHLDVPEEWIVAGNGSDEIIDLLIRVKARPGKDHVLLFEPSFSMYRLLARLCGVEVRTIPLDEDFHFPWVRMLQSVTEETAVVFVTTPDNPTGYAPEVQELESVAGQLPPHVLLVVDEAYMDFARPMDEYTLLPRLKDMPNVVVLRTFSKLYGLAGLRLGYGVMPPWLADALIRVKPPFSVNILAEVAGTAALQDIDFTRATLDCVITGRTYLATELERMGCRVFPSQANFLLFKLGRANRNELSAQHVFQELLRRGVIIRPLKSYGLDEYLRVSIGTEEENQIFIREIEAVLHG
ncbi:histidinol-phosphate aminotransferase [Desulfonatronum thiosulfatophilum]|uniref:Histidinol-phosphate aminotransferase n=1 Tax=Desulfonatronum thiosulfatophilum TaxID=617002 RepID=A0A1G6EE84_9BACT|nr:histidinol-phosphate aminotransferase [Desulfonatronum thiosulfatophilum]